MGNNKTYLEQINDLSHLLPLEILQDINKRVTDWLVSGGNENDPYIEQQLRFAKNFINFSKNKNFKWSKE
jgi:hypothetical protein